MNADIKPHRRPEFDAIADGWGSDTIQDLTARMELLVEFQNANGGTLSLAEDKVMRAMVKYRGLLEGAPRA